MSDTEEIIVPVEPPTQAKKGRGRPRKLKDADSGGEPKPISKIKKDVEKLRKHVEMEHSSDEDVDTWVVSRPSKSEPVQVKSETKENAKPKKEKKEKKAPKKKEPPTPAPTFGESKIRSPRVDTPLPDYKSLYENEIALRQKEKEFDHRTLKVMRHDLKDAMRRGGFLVNVI